MSNSNSYKQTSPNKKSVELSSSNIGNLLSYGSINLTLTIDLFYFFKRKSIIMGKNKTFFN